jgi:hypothetical protein
LVPCQDSIEGGDDEPFFARVVAKRVEERAHAGAGHPHGHRRCKHKARGE